MYRPVNLYCLYTCVIGSQKIKKTSSVVGYHIEMPANARLRSSGFVAGESFFLFQFVAGAPTNACLAHLWITMGLLGRSSRSTRSVGDTRRACSRLAASHSSKMPWATDEMDANPWRSRYMPWPLGYGTGASALSGLGHSKRVSQVWPKEERGRERDRPPAPNEVVTKDRTTLQMHPRPDPLRKLRRKEIGNHIGKETKKKGCTAMIRTAIDIGTVSPPG